MYFILLPIRGCILSSPVICDAEFDHLVVGVKVRYIFPIAVGK